MDLGWKLRNSYLGKKKRHLRNPWTDIKDQNVGPCATKISPDLRPFPPPRTRGAPVCAGGSSQWWPGAEICSKGAVLYWSWNLKQKVFPVEVGSWKSWSSIFNWNWSWKLWSLEVRRCFDFQLESPWFLGSMSLWNILFEIFLNVSPQTCLFGRGSFSLQ